MLLTQRDKGAVNRQLPQTTTLAWIKRESLWTLGPTGTATREQNENFVKKNNRLSFRMESVSSRTSVMCIFGQAFLCGAYYVKS